MSQNEHPADFLLTRPALIIIGALSGFMVMRFIASKDTDFVDDLDLCLSLFNLFGAFLLLRLDKEARM
jgi:hypothetical protein